tara:strand:- start:778 stop:1536 length:759 start_codon:yes stop_codon:yes gene_type:complete
MRSKPTDLSAVDERVLEIQDAVREHFGWGLDADIESARDLLAAVEASDVDEWARARRAQTVASLHRRLVLRESEVAILGAAITTEEVEEILAGNVRMIAADGSCGVLDTLPDSMAERAWSRLVCVVSDADGGDGTIAAVKRGIPIILHAHGDNTEAWGELLSLASARRTPPPIVLTHQTPAPIAGMHNPGGFTDGDRAVCFARALGIPRERIVLLGTRTDIIGDWSGATDPERKLVKLQWMAKVLQYLGFLV